ncbi:ATP-binding protein [Aureibacter tunicatorum]|uniref:AAA+ superfamily predicted ATPase n=1 Tax=Aureibacter tunicatorum TaxID=866807 RepID=A0AAE3XLK4_9BACT|nr:AAA family ATPase [Aureibacter tunicatorum]MDR6238833.1 AAA+ superfamily predicted ATPase [Aureibacter tunicatorum]BDD05240.1 hypothetical protein AUTU_27230 [Aureibacter tunicatorum]
MATDAIFEEKKTVKREGVPTLEHFDQLDIENKKYPQTLVNNIQALMHTKAWLVEIIGFRLNNFSDESKSHSNIYDIRKQFAMETNSHWDEISKSFNLTLSEQFLLSAIFFSQFEPQLFIELFSQEELNVYFQKDKQRLIPTLNLRSIIYLLSGEDYLNRAVYLNQLAQSVLFKERILIMDENDSTSFEDAVLAIHPAYYQYLLNGKKPKLEVSAEFPAIQLTTNKTMDDLVLKDSVKDQLDLLMDFVRHKNAMYSNESFKQKVKEGYVAMLYGPPGTGKTMSVAAMGKELGVDVYAVDLSRIVSKYIGETEKNLEKVFARLEDKDCILFFDEADALFGKRTEVKDSKDRYANQEVAYLLQKIEQFKGLVLLASNYNQNLDKAFRRRILTSIFMAPPSEKERLILWEKALPENFRYEPEGLPAYLAKEHSVTGANIANVIKLSCLRAHTLNTQQIDKKTIEYFIKLELDKEKN